MRLIYVRVFLNAHFKYETLIMKSFMFLQLLYFSRCFTMFPYINYVRFPKRWRWLFSHFKKNVSRIDIKNDRIIGHTCQWKKRNGMKIEIAIRNFKFTGKEVNPFKPFIWNCRSFLWKSVFSLLAQNIFTWEKKSFKMFYVWCTK